MQQDHTRTTTLLLVQDPQNKAKNKLKIVVCATESLVQSIGSVLSVSESYTLTLHDNDKVR